MRGSCLWMMCECDCPRVVSVDRVWGAGGSAGASAPVVCESQIVIEISTLTALFTALLIADVISQSSACIRGSDCLVR